MQRGGRSSHQTPSREVYQGQDTDTDTSTQLQKLRNEAVPHGGLPGQVNPVAHPNLSSSRLQGTIEVPTSVHALEVQGQQLQVVAPELISVADYLAHSAATRSVGASQRQDGSPARNAFSLAFPGTAGYRPPSCSPVIESIVAQPLSTTFQRPNLAQGESSRKLVQKCLGNTSGGSSSDSSRSGREPRTAPLSFPFSPSRENPLHTSPVKPIKSIMSVVTNQPPTEVVELRRKTLEEKRKTLKEVQNSYMDKLTELFFLQQNHNMMDYVIWKKKQPDPQLASYLKSRQLEERPHDQSVEAKATTPSSSTVPPSTPKATSSQLPQELKKRSDESGSGKGQHRSGGSSVVSASESRKRTSSQAGLDEAGEERSIKLSLGGSDVSTKSESSSTASSRTMPSITVIPATGVKPGSEEVPMVTKVAADASDIKGSVGIASPMRRNTSSPSSALGQLPSTTLVKTHFPPGLSRERQGTRQGALSAVYDYTIGSQEMIVERAKQEAQVMQRIAELRRDGLWSAKRLPRVQEPPRHKSHWDYLLEEMQWLAADFAQERRWKKNAARKLARAVAKHHQEQEAKEMKAGREEVMKLKRIAGNIAKEIKAFWANIEKVVQYKQQSRLDEQRKKALDLQLDFIVGQTEKYSSWLTEGLNTSTAGSSAQGSSVSSPRSDRVADDLEFRPQEDESDDEETIDVEEKQAAKAGEESGVSEIELLQRESELPIEELLSSLQEAQKAEEKRSSRSKGEEEKTKEEEKPDASLEEVTAPESKISESKDDKDFELSADEEEAIDDDEKTLDEQEEVEGTVDHKAELDDLAAQGEIPIEELLKQYEGAYAEDFDFSDVDEEDDESEDEEEDTSQDSSSEEEEVEEEDEDKDELKDVGMEYLINPEKESEDLPDKPSQGTSDDAGPNREITDIAAAAQSLQPTGYTLSDYQVKTKVPFLLRHTLREYQHIGLDWLVTMLEKKLNGILADEMGLGKTIQTIALLAHLACEEACWGPHLIVVPTSVMLNWEMEFKKWCPGFKILTYYGSQKERKLKRTGWTKSNAFHVCITSYKLVIQDHQSFRRKKWKYLVLDEAQNIKNFKSQRWQTLLNFSSQRRLLLTGTPLQNNLMELWSLMHFLMPHVFQSHREFKEWFSNPLGGMIEGTQEYNEGIIRRLHKVLRPFLLRRLKSQVEKQLPQKYEHVIRCRLSKRQRFLYDDFMGQTKTKETLTTGHFMSVINVLMQLRKVCNHPDLFEERQIVSPFIMVGLLYYTASLVHRVMEYNPLKEVSFRALNLCIADLEISLPAYAAHRTCQLQTPRKLIEEIDSSPDPPPRPPRVKVKPGKLYPSPMALQAQKEARASPSLVNRPSDRASPSSLHIHGRGSPSIVRVGSPNSKATSGPPGLTQVLVRSNSGVLQTRAPTPPQGAAGGTSQILQAHSRPGTPPVTLTAISNPRSPGTLTLVSQNPQPVPSGTPLQQLPGYTGTTVASQLGQRRVLLQQQQVSGVGTNGRAQLITTQPITVQLQSGSSSTTQQSNQRLLAGQIRQLPQGGIVQIIQTSGGQQIIRPAVQLTSQANVVNAQRTVNSQSQVVQRPGTPQMVLSHTAAQLQAAQQLHQSIQRQLTAQGVSPSQAQAVASQLSKVTAAQSPLQLQQRQIILQQQQQPQQVVINAKGATVHTTPATQTVTCASSTSRPSSPSVTIVQAARSVNASSPTLGTARVSSPSSKTVVAVSSASADRTTNSASPTPKVVRASSPSVKTTSASVSPKNSAPIPPLTPLKMPVIRLKPVQLLPSKVKEESKEAKEAAEKLRKAERKRKSSPLYLESLDKAIADERKSSLSRIATFNQQRCSAKPVYGQDLFTAVSLYHTSRPAGKRRPFSNGVGNIHCYHSLVGDALRRVEVGYKKTRNLRNVLHTPQDYLDQLQRVIEKYTFVVPAVTAPLITMHTSHTPPSVMNKERMLVDTLSTQLKPKARCLHPIENRMRMDMPELRLIQYDCGKLQTMDILLRKLKAEGSRVLIFTQMTKMLDILERFLNYHGHIYLRLDGTTKVEQRQIMMERFNKDPRIFCFILSTRSGGMGVNLTGANAVIFYDSDWNPTMDAQAQDRCHRIGQTRDVHIYRLISEMSIEENILKKSNQKRLLIDVSIEGGNFTTAFFKKHTIRDIFDVSKDAGTLQDLVQVEKAPAEEPKESPPTEQEAKVAPKPLSQTELEKALARAEDDTDVKAASRAHAEQDAELAEFDESIPYEGEEGKGKEETSKLEIELAQLNDQLTPIERYAVIYLEDTLEPITAEQLKEAEEQVEAAKREWELGRLQALKEQEERETELEEDEVLYTYSREDSENQVHKSSKNGKRKEKSKGTGEKSARDIRQSRRDSREKGRRISGGREGSRTSGSRTSSRAGSPPAVERQTRKVRSRASSGASGTEGDLSRRTTRSRTSSGSGSDRLPSPRGGERANRMAEREKRRDTPHRDTSQPDTPRPVGRPRTKTPQRDPLQSDTPRPRPVGRPRIKSADSAKSPERILPKRKSRGSDSGGVESRSVALRRSRSPDAGSVFSNGDQLTTRSGRSRRRSASVSEGSKVSGNLEPVVETVKTSPPKTGVEEELSNHVIGQSKDTLPTDNMKNIEDHEQGSPMDAEKRTRNIFDIVDTTMRIKDKIKDAIGPASGSGIGVGNVLEKINTRSLFAGLAKKFKKKNVPEKSLPIQEEESDGKSNLETVSMNHHPVTDSTNEVESISITEQKGVTESANEVESRTMTEGKREQESVDTIDTETEMVVDPQDNDSKAVETKQDDPCDHKSPSPRHQDNESIEVETKQEVNVCQSPSPQHEPVQEELPVKINDGNKDRNVDEDVIVDTVEPDRTPDTSEVPSISAEAPKPITDSVETTESTEAKSETLMDQGTPSIQTTNPTPASSVHSKDSDNLDVGPSLDVDNEQEIAMEVVVDDSPTSNEGDINNVRPVVEEEQKQSETQKDHTSPVGNEIPENECSHTAASKVGEEEVQSVANNDQIPSEENEIPKIVSPKTVATKDVEDKEIQSNTEKDQTTLSESETPENVTCQTSTSKEVEDEESRSDANENQTSDEKEITDSTSHQIAASSNVDEEEIQSDSHKDQTSTSKNELASQDVHEEKSVGENSSDQNPDMFVSPSKIVEQAPESVKEIEPVEEEQSISIVSKDLDLRASVDGDTKVQTIEKIPEITVSSPDIPGSDSTPAAIPDNMDPETSILPVTSPSVSDVEKDKDGTQDGENVEVKETKVEAEKEHDSRTVEHSTERKQLGTGGGKDIEQINEDVIHDNRNIEQGSTSEVDQQNNEIVVEKVPLLDLSEVNNDDTDEGGHSKNTSDEAGAKKDIGESSSQVDEDSETESVELTMPPKPTRRVREIMNLILPGDKPLNLDIDTPAARTRSRNTGDTPRTRSRVKPSSSPNLGSVFTPPRASPRSSPRSGGKASTKKAADSPSSVAGVKRSPRLASPSGLQSKTKKTRSSNAS